MVKKYVNLNRTIILDKRWVPYGAEAIILEEGQDSYVLKFKDINSCKISKKEFNEFFSPSGEVSDNDLFEFNFSKNRKKKKLFVDIIKKHYKDQDEIKNLLLSALKKADTDAFNAPGDIKCLTHKQYFDFQESNLKLNPLEEIGSPFFNRRKRWSVVAEVTEWEERGKPAPIGIKPGDYASLKECNLIFLELIKQIFSMSDIPFIPSEIESELGEKIFPGSYRCRYCGEKISILSFKNQEYKSKNHELNFCHRIPGGQIGTTCRENVYIGHTVCNQIQGGVSEEYRILDGLRLLKLHEKEYKDYPEIKKAINSLKK